MLENSLASSERKFVASKQLMLIPTHPLRWYLLVTALLIAGTLLLPGDSLAADPSMDTGSVGWTSLLPPLVAIGLALILREVVGSLLLGVFVGSLLLTPTQPGQALLAIATDFMLNAVADPAHAAIILFSLMLGGMVGILKSSGAMSGIVQLLGSLTKSRRGGLLVSWLMGLIIFFDDYANTLLVGNTLQPYTDRLKISRAKLAYIVDSTAAPVASIAIISTWVGFQIGLIRDASLGIEAAGDAYVLFIRAIPYSAYSILALVLVASLAWWKRDFGPMLKAEREAINGNDISREEDVSGFSSDEVVGRHPILLALVPIGLVIFATFTGLYLSGRSDAEVGAPLFEILGQADSSAVLMSASFLGVLAAAFMTVLVGKLQVSKVSGGLIDGMRSMMPAMVILTLAWSLGDVSGRLGTANFVIESVSGKLSPMLLPAALFVIASVTAFSTGTSWGAMAILIPISIPLAYQLPLEAGCLPHVADGILLGSVGAVLSGATFGDHCSPISDTTILSSMASGCKHIDHVNTQIPYALLAGVVAILFGYLPAGLGLPVWLTLPAGIIILFILPRYIARLSQ